MKLTVIKANGTLVGAKMVKDEAGCWVQVSVARDSDGDIPLGFRVSYEDAEILLADHPIGTRVHVRTELEIGPQIPAESGG